MTTKEFWLLDLDRTLLNLDALVQSLYDVLDETGVMPSHEIRQKRTQVEDDGGSFSPVAVIMEYGGESLWRTVQQRLIECADQNRLRLPGATELLRRLDTDQHDYAIVTYGVPAWQRLKLQLSGFGSVPYLIIDTPRKGKLIDSWRHDDGYFILPAALGKTGETICTASLVLVDDKQLAFDGLPTQVRGYWVQTGLEAGVDTVLAGVTTCATLHEVIRHVT